MNKPDYSSPSLWLDLTAANDRIAELDAKIKAQRDLMLEAAGHMAELHEIVDYIYEVYGLESVQRYVNKQTPDIINRLEGRE